MTAADLPGSIAARIDTPGFARWLSMVNATGGCSHPIRLVGETTTYDPGTGEVLHRFATADAPPGYLLVACKNRRASVCPSCAETYRRDAFHLLRAGLAGGKGVPEDVRQHPRLFLTLTAPSFGTIHTRRTRDGRPAPCLPRRDPDLCRCGEPIACHRTHDPDDPATGQPLCPDCYDYPGAVLWNAHAGPLWRRYTTYLTRALAAGTGRTRTQLRRDLRLSYAKVAEYQARGQVHLHAVIRLDGPDGPDQPPPPWADLTLLTDAITAAHTTATLPAPTPAYRQPIRYGTQIDLRPITEFGTGHEITETRVAGYIAKYATKGAEAAGTINHRIRNPRAIPYLDVTDHARRMIHTCWLLGDMPEYTDLGLRRWSHTLGYPGRHLVGSSIAVCPLPTVSPWTWPGVWSAATCESRMTPSMTQEASVGRTPTKSRMSSRRPVWSARNTTRTTRRRIRRSGSGCRTGRSSIG